MRFRACHIGLLIVAAIIGGLVVPTGVDRAAAGVELATSSGPGADPDTAAVTLNRKPTYVTVSTTAESSAACSRRFAWLPYFVHGDKDAVEFDGVCPTGDLLDNFNGGKWIDVKWVGREADREVGLWAPSIFEHDGEFYLHYSGVVKGTKQRCIWALHASSLEGLKFAPRRLFACPDDQADLAIDPDMFEHQGRLYVTYRDDGGSIAAAESAIYVTEVDRDGLPIGKRRQLLHSATLPWTHYRAESGEVDQVVENPSLMFNNPTGEWLLFYSGNNFEYATYGTGVARCGSNLMSGATCQPIGGSRRAYIGFSGAVPSWGIAPKHSMPGNLPGSAGVSVFETHYGGYAAVWHAWDRGAPSVEGPAGPEAVQARQGQGRTLHASPLRLPTQAHPNMVRFRPGPIVVRTCRGEPATVDLALGQTPTRGDDVIVGTARDDVIDGRGGDDRICSWRGNDRIDGGPGNDVIYGGKGADSIAGSTGSDVIYGGAGPDMMDGGFGYDTCRGAGGDDAHRNCAVAVSTNEIVSSAIVAGDETVQLDSFEPASFEPEGEGLEVAPVEPSPTPAEGADQPTPVSVDPLDTVSGDPLDTAPGEPPDTVSGDPLDTVSVDPLDAALVEPADAALVDPLDTVSGDPLDTVSVDPLDTVSVDPLDTAPVDPPDTVSVDPLDTATGEPPDTVSVDPLDAALVDPLDTAPGDPPDAALVEPADAALVEPLDTVSGDPPDASLVEPVDAASVEPTE